MVTVAPAAAAAVIANLTSVETVKLTNGGTAAQTLNMIGVTGTTTVESRLSSADVTFDNLQAAAKVVANGTTAGEITAKFANSLASGTADSVTVELNSGATAHFNVGGTTAANEFETVNIISSGAQKNTLSNIEASDSTVIVGKTAFVLSGSADLTMANAITAGAGSTIDATAMTGKATILVGADTVSAKGGQGDDTINIVGRTLADNTVAAQTFDGGAGQDTLVIGGAFAETDLVAKDAGKHVYAAETVNYKPAAAGDHTIEASAFTGMQKLVIDAVAGDADGGDDLDVITVTKLAADQTVQINHTSSVDTANVDGTHVSIALKDATGAADAITVALSNTDTASVLGVLTSSGATETVNLQANNAKGYTVTSVQAASAKALNISGSGDVTLGSLAAVNLAASTATVNQIINASSMTGKLTIGAAASAGFEAESVTVTGGSGDDAFYFGTTLDDKDVVDGGAGNDTVYMTEATAAALKAKITAETLNVAVVANDRTIDMTNMSVGTVLFEAATDAGTVEDLIIDKASATDLVTLKTATGKTFEADSVTIGVATGVTNANVKLTGAGVAVHAGGVELLTNAGSLTVTDAIVGTDGFYENNMVLVGGTASTAKLTKLVLAGGGKSAATTTAAVTVDHSGANILLKTIDATALASDLNISALVTTEVDTLAAVNLASGDNKVTINQALMARDAVRINGGEGKDTIAVTVGDATADTSYRLGSTGVETLAITATVAGGGADANDYAIDLQDTTGIGTLTITLAGTDDNFKVTNASGVTALKLAGTQAAATNVVSVAGATSLTVTNTAAVGGTAADLTAADATTVTIKQGNASATAFDTATFAKATNVTLGGADKATDGTAYAGAVTVATLDAAALTDLAVDSTNGKVTVSTVTANKLARVVAIGSEGLDFGLTGATTAALASFDASAATGVTKVGQAVDFTSSAIVKLGTGNDEITLDILTEGGVTVDGGAKTDDTDNLKLAGINNLGLTVVDLSAADQVTQLNGGINSAVQSNFESIDLSGLTGSFGANITGSSVANAIVGTKNADNIVAGEGADTITGGDGADTIDLTESTAAIDKVHLDTVASVDTITGLLFGDNATTKTDLLQIDDGALVLFTLDGTAIDTSAANVSAVFEAGTVTAAIDLSGLSDGENILVLSGTHASQQALYDVIADGGLGEIKLDNTVAEGEKLVIVWQDTSSNYHLSVLTVDLDDGDTDALQNGTETIADLAVVTITGGTIDVDNFVFTA